MPISQDDLACLGGAIRMKREYIGGGLIKRFNFLAGLIASPAIGLAFALRTVTDILPSSSPLMPLASRTGENLESGPSAAAAR